MIIEQRELVALHRKQNRTGINEVINFIASIPLIITYYIIIYCNRSNKFPSRNIDSTSRGLIF